MKLRIKGNSIRFRLSKSEVESFAREGKIEESTDFGNSKLSYSLIKWQETENLSAKLSDNKITLFLPEKIAIEWTSTELVGFDYKMDIGNGKQLFLLVEKDYACIDNTLEDQSDNYPNPNVVC